MRIAIFNPRVSPDLRAKLKALRSIAEKKGFALISGSVISTPRHKKALAAFLRLIDKMPADVYDKNNARRRFVTYAHFYKPIEDGDTLLYFTEPQYDIDVGAKLFQYQLSGKFQPENAESRKFAPVPDKALKHPFLHELIEAGFHVAPLQANYRGLPIEVEVQFIRYEPRRNRPALGTPPTTHQDNDWAFCIFLLEWENVEGPINAFVPVEHSNKALETIPQEKITRITLVETLGGYCVEDTKIAHYVGPVELKMGAEYGRRTIVILSYKPLIPLRPEDVKTTVEALRTNPKLLEEKPDAPESIEIDPNAATRLPPGVRPKGGAVSGPITLRRSRY
jgi:hypothetical protein